MRVLSTACIVAWLGLAGCANQTPAEKAATLACPVDQAGTVLRVVATPTATPGQTTGQTVAIDAGTVVMSAATDPNCAAAIAAAANATPADAPAKAGGGSLSQ